MGIDREANQGWLKKTPPFPEGTISSLRKTLEASVVGVASNQPHNITLTTNQIYAILFCVDK